MSGRSWKVYVLPPSVVSGSVVAILGTRVAPSTPPVRLNPTNHSLVTPRIPQDSGEYATPGSSESNGKLKIVMVPPRYLSPSSRTATHKPSSVIAVIAGEAPTSI